MWQTPCPLENPSEVDRRKQQDQLFAPHVANLNKMVERIREIEFDDMSVPWFDPMGAGVFARVLMLLQDPSRIAEGTGFVSPDNPDRTADNTTYFRNEANLRSDELIHWNIVPWAINGRNANLEIERAKQFFSVFIQLLTNLKVVVCMGVKARNGWNKAYPNNLCIPGWKPYSNNFKEPIVAFTCPHPSWQGVNGYHKLVDGLTAAERIEKTLANVRKILDKN